MALRQGGGPAPQRPRQPPRFPLPHRPGIRRPPRARIRRLLCRWARCRGAAGARGPRLFLWPRRPVPAARERSPGGAPRRLGRAFHPAALLPPRRERLGSGPAGEAAREHRLEAHRLDPQALAHRRDVESLVFEKAQDLCRFDTRADRREAGQRSRAEEDRRRDRNDPHLSADRRGNGSNEIAIGNRIAAGDDQRRPRGGRAVERALEAGGDILDMNGLHQRVAAARQGDDAEAADQRGEALSIAVRAADDHGRVQNRPGASRAHKCRLGLLERLAERIAIAAEAPRRAGEDDARRALRQGRENLRRDRQRRAADNRIGIGEGAGEGGGIGEIDRPRRSAERSETLGRAAERDHRDPAMLETREKKEADPAGRADEGDGFRAGHQPKRKARSGVPGSFGKSKPSTGSRARKSPLVAKRRLRKVISRQSGRPSAARPAMLLPWRWTMWKRSSAAVTCASKTLRSGSVSWNSMVIRSMRSARARICGKTRYSAPSMSILRKIWLAAPMRPKIASMVASLP